MPASPRRRTTRATTGKSSLNSPQRERLPGAKSGVTIVKKVKLTVVTAASERPSFSESQRMERANVFIEFDLNEHSVLVALLVNTKDSCRDGSHICHFLCQTSPEMEPAPKRASGTDRHQRRRENRRHSRLSSTKSSVIARQACSDGRRHASA